MMTHLDKLLNKRELEENFVFLRCKDKVLNRDREDVKANR